MATTDPQQEPQDWAALAAQHRQMTEAMLGTDDKPSNWKLNQQERFNLQFSTRDQSERGFWESVFTDATGDTGVGTVLPFVNTISEEIGWDKLEGAFQRFEGNQATRDDIDRISKYLEWQSRESTSLSRIGAMSGQIGAFMGENAITMGVFGGVAKTAKVALAGRRAALMNKIANVGLVSGTLKAGQKFGSVLKGSKAAQGARAIVDTKVGQALNNVLIKAPASMGKAMIGAESLVGAAGMTAGKEVIAQVGGAVTSLMTDDFAGAGAGRFMNAAHAKYLEKKYGYEVSKYGLEVVSNSDVTLLEFVPREIFDQYIENWTEQVGGSLTLGIAALNKSINSEFLSRVILKEGAKDSMEAGAKRVFERIASTGYNGFVQENFEEIMGASARQLAGEVTGDEEWANTYKEFWTAQNWLEMSASIALGTGAATRGAAAFQGALDSFAGGAPEIFRQEVAADRAARIAESQRANAEVRAEVAGVDSELPQANLWRGTADEAAVIRKAEFEGFLMAKAAEEVERRKATGESGVPTVEELFASERINLEVQFGQEAENHAQAALDFINNKSDALRQQAIDDAVAAASEAGVTPETATEEVAAPAEGEAAPEVAPEAAPEAEPPAEDGAPEFFEADTSLFDEDPERPGVVAPEAQATDSTQYGQESAEAARDFGAEAVPYDQLTDDQKRLVNIAFRNNKSVSFVRNMENGAQAVHDRRTGRIAIDADKAATNYIDIRADGTEERLDFTPQQAIEANFLHEAFHRLARKFGARYVKRTGDAMDRTLPGVRAKNEATYRQEWAALQETLPQEQRRELTDAEFYEEGVTRTLESFVGYMGAISAANDIQTFGAILAEEGTGFFKRVVDALYDGVRAAAFLGPHRRQSVQNLRDTLADIEGLGDLGKLTDEQLVRQAAIIQNFLEGWRGANQQKLDTDEGSLLGWRRDIKRAAAPEQDEGAGLGDSAELTKARTQLAKLEAQLSVQEQKKKNKLNEKKRKDLVRRVNKAKRKVAQLEKAAGATRAAAVEERVAAITEPAAAPAAEPSVQGPPALPATEIGPQRPVQGPPQLPATEVGPQRPIQGPPQLPATEIGPQQPKPVADMGYRELQREAKRLGVRANQKRAELEAAITASRQGETVPQTEAQPQAQPQAQAQPEAQPEAQPQAEVQEETTTTEDLEAGEREMATNLAFARGQQLAEDLGFENAPWSEIEQELEDKALQEDLSPSEQALLVYGPMVYPEAFDLWMARDERILNEREQARKVSSDAGTDPKNDAQHNLPRQALGTVDQDGRLQFNLRIPGSVTGRDLSTVLLRTQDTKAFPRGYWEVGLRNDLQRVFTEDMVTDAWPNAQVFADQVAAEVVIEAATTGIEMEFVNRFVEAINRLDLPGTLPQLPANTTAREAVESLLLTNDFITPEEKVTLFNAAEEVAAEVVEKMDLEGLIKERLARRNLTLDPAIAPVIDESARQYVLLAAGRIIQGAAANHAIELFEQGHSKFISGRAAGELAKFFVMRAMGDYSGNFPSPATSVEAFDITKAADREALLIKHLDNFKHAVVDPITKEPVLVTHSTRTVFKEGKAVPTYRRPFVQFTRVLRYDMQYQANHFGYFYGKHKNRITNPYAATQDPRTGRDYTGAEVLGIAAVLGYNDKLTPHDSRIDRERLAANLPLEQLRDGRLQYDDETQRLLVQQFATLWSMNQGVSMTASEYAYGGPANWDAFDPGLITPETRQQFLDAADVSDSFEGSGNLRMIQSDLHRSADDARGVLLWASQATAEAFGFQDAYDPDADIANNENAGYELSNAVEGKIRAWLNEPGAFRSKEWWLSDKTRAVMITLRNRGMAIPNPFTDWPQSANAQAPEILDQTNYRIIESHTLVNAAVASGADMLVAREAKYLHFTALRGNEQARNAMGNLDLQTQAVNANLARGMNLGTDAAPFAPKPKSKLDRTTPVAPAVGPAYTQPIDDPSGRAISKTMGVVTAPEGGLQYVANLTHEDQAMGVWAVDEVEVPASIRSATAQHMLHHAMQAGAEHISVSDPELAQTIAELSGASILDDGLVYLDNRVYERAGEQYNLGGLKAARNRRQKMLGHQSWSDNDARFQLNPEKGAKPGPASRANANTRVDYEAQDALISGYLASMDRNVFAVNRLSMQHEELLVKMLPEGATEAAKAKHVRRYGRAIHLWIDMKGNDERLSMDQLEAKWRKDMAANGKAITSEMEQMVADAKSLSGPTLKLAQTIARQNLEFGQRLVDAGLLKNAREYYSARLWFLEPEIAESRDFSDPATGAIDPTRPGGRFLTTLGGRAKQRVYNSIFDGWAEGRKLTVDNAIVAQHKVMRDGHEALVNSGFAKSLEAQGIMVRVKAGQRPPEGYKRIISNSRSFDQMYALPDVANELGAMTTRFSWEGLGRLARPARAVYNLQARAKSTLLFTSLFHHQAFLRSYYYAVPEVMDQLGDAPQMALASLQSIFSPQAGTRRFMETKAAKAAFAAIMSNHPDLDILVANGMTLSLGMTYSLKAENNQAWRRTWLESAVNAASPEFAERMADHRIAASDFLFGKMGTALKAQTALLEYRHMLHKNKDALDRGDITRNQIAAIVAEKTNDDFGGLNLRRGKQIIGGARRPGAQLVMRTLFLAPDWTESNFNTLFKAMPFRPDTEDKERMTVIQRKQYEKQRSLQTQAYMTLYAQAMIRSQVMTVAFNALMAGLDDEETMTSIYNRSFGTAFEDAGLFGIMPRDFNFLKADITLAAKLFNEWTGMEGAPKHAGSRVYFNVLGHFLDPFNWISKAYNKDLTGPIKGKLSPFMRALSSAMTGEDWRGMSYTPVDEMIELTDEELLGFRLNLSSWEFGGGKSGLTSAPSLIIEQISNNLPIFMQSGFRLAVGEDSAFDFLSDSFGFHMTRDYDRPSGGSSSRSDFLVGDI